MSIDPINLAVALFTAITALAASATYFIYRRQAKTMEAQWTVTQKQIEVAQEQLTDLRSSRDGQQLYQVISMLLDIRPDVERVLGLRDRPIDQWTREEEASAHVVASKFHLTGLLVLQKVVPEELLAKAWYYSIPQCYEILTPFLRKMRNERDQYYWSAFDELAVRVKQHAAAFCGFSSSPALTDKKV
jgi:hypothetical protein